MWYEDPPGGGTPIVVGTINDIEACRPFVLVTLASFGIPSRDREDLAQDVVIVSWDAMREGRIRGPRTRPPEASLRAYLHVVARAVASNHRFRAAHRGDGLGVDLEDNPALVAPDLSAQVEARDALRIALTLEGPRARMFLRAAEGEDVRSAAREEGVPRATYHRRLEVAREALRKRLREPEPPQPVPPTTKRRKRKR